MKYLLLALITLSGTSAMADSVSVNINGKNYSCSEGGSSSSCECKMDPKDSHYVWVHVAGNQLYRWSFDGGSGIAACKRWIKENSAICN